MLERLPAVNNSSTSLDESVGEQIEKFLASIRYTDTSIPRRQAKKRLNIEAGKSVQASDFDEKLPTPKTIPRKLSRKASDSENSANEDDPSEIDTNSNENAPEQNAEPQPGLSKLPENTRDDVETEGNNVSPSVSAKDVSLLTKCTQFFPT